MSGFCGVARMGALEAVLAEMERAGWVGLGKKK